MTKSRRRLSSGATPGAVVAQSPCCGTTWPSAPTALRATVTVVAQSPCCGTTWPSAPTALRATVTHARSTILARRAKSPVRGQAKSWSPKTSVSPPHPGEGPHRFKRRGGATQAAWLPGTTWWLGRPGWRSTGTRVRPSFRVQAGAGRHVW